MGRACLPFPSGLSGGHAHARGRLRRDDGPARRASAAPGRGRAAHGARGRRGARIRRRDDQAAAPHAGRVPGRGGRHAPPRPPHRLPLVAVRLPARLHVLRDGRDGPRPQPALRGDRGAAPGPRADPARPGRDGRERGDDGDGRALPELRRRARGVPDDARPRRVQPRRAPHRDLDRRLGAGHRTAGGGAAAAPARALAARTDRRAARAADARHAPVSDRAADGGLPRLPRAHAAGASSSSTCSSTA